MFPFKTKTFLLQLDIPQQEFSDRIVEYNRRYRFLELYRKVPNAGVVSGVTMDKELSEVPFFNSFRPVIVFRWTGNGSQTAINGYYRLSRSIIALSFCLPIVGIVQSFRFQDITPFAFFCLLWIVSVQLFSYLFFRKEFGWVESNFHDMIEGTLRTT